MPAMRVAVRVSSGRAVLMTWRAGGSLALYTILLSTGVKALASALFLQGTELQVPH